MSEIKYELTPATLGEIARVTRAKLWGDENLPVADVTHDSRKVGAGWLFVAVRGERFDAHEFIPEVMRRGVVGVMSERAKPDDFTGAWLQVAEIRHAHAAAADLAQGQPSRQLKLVGVTGTNGKTTCVYLLHALAVGANVRDAMLTTVEYVLGDERGAAEYTTPEASDTQRFLRRAVDAGCTVAAMESSSQALDLRRCDALAYSVAIFTNFTRDHLDYHRTMEVYWDAKLRLFDGRLGSRPAVSIINIDDVYGARLAEKLKTEGQNVITYALERAADLRADEIETELTGTRFYLISCTEDAEDRIEIKTALVGRPNVYNSLAAISAGLALGFDLQTMIETLRDCAGAPGRFEYVPHAAGDFAVVVDYAHTDDALANVLKTAREVVKGKGRVISVFGCGGDRDTTKRAPMGRIAGELSDLAIATSDNPRTENPEKILGEIEVGLKKSGGRYERVALREAAIQRAVELARDGDLILIAGKGHENYQIIGREKVHFDDREIAASTLAEK